MNFYNEDEKKDGAAGIPPFKKTATFGRTPLFSRAAGGIMDRLKNLSRKDMAFVGIGLSVLVMAPVAEYMMSKPSADNLLTPGFGSREGSAVPNGGVYEPGINALSQGSPDGSGEVITPLSSRDPASLILGSQPAQAAAPAPYTPPPTSYRDSMKDVARESFSAAAKSAGAPTPIPRMQAALRSFGSFFSGGEGTRTQGSIGGGKIIEDAKSASSKAAKRSMVGPVAMPGYKGVASNTPNSSSKGAFEKLRSAADKSAGNFNGGSAISSLDKAAADAPQIGSGSGGLGYGQDSAATTKPSNSNNKYEHNRSGESLEEMAAKHRMQKALEWEDFKKYEIPKQIINAIVEAVGGVMKDLVDDKLRTILKMYPPGSYCWQPAVCPDGNCADKVKEYKKTAPVDLCYDPGAQKFSWESAGKEKSTGGQVNCICGKGSEPIGKKYQPGGTPPPADQNNNNHNNPDNPQAGGGDGHTPAAGSPEAISQDTNKLFAKYDEVLGRVIDNVVFTEKALNDNKKPEEIEVQVKALEDVAKEAGGAASSVVQPTLAKLGSEAKTALSRYFNRTDAMEKKYRAAKAEHDTYVKAVAAIRADIKNHTLKMKDTAPTAKSGEPTAGRNSESEINTKPIEDIIAKYDQGITDNLGTARGQRDYHTYRFGVFSRQLDQVTGSIEGLVQAHNTALGAMNSALAAADTPASERLAKATGRPAVGGNAPAATGDKTIGAAVGTKVKEATGQALNDNAAPLQRAVAVRAVNWDLLWPQKEARKFDSTAAATDEKKLWSAYLEKVNARQEADIAPTGNFVANAARSAAIQGEVATVDFGNLQSIINSAVADMRIVQQTVLMSVNACYFASAGCSSAITPSGSADGNATVLTAQGLANGVYKDFHAADQKYSQLKPEQKAVISSAHDSLQSAADQVEEKQQALDKLVKSKAPADQIAKATGELAGASKEYTRVQAAYDASYDAARKTLTGAQKSALADYQTVLSCDDAVTGFVPHGSGMCSKSLSTRVGTIGSSADRDYGLIMNDDPASANAGARLANQKKTACTWASKCLKQLPAGCK